MGRSMQALTVFSLAIKFLKEHLMKKIHLGMKGILGSYHDFLDRGMPLIRKKN
jgi:hypothetical protein